jgi:hypothetical protein
MASKGNFIEVEGVVKKINQAFVEHVDVVKSAVQIVKSLNNEYDKFPSAYAKGLKEATENYNKSAVAVEKLKQNTQKLVEAKAKLAPKTSEEIVNGRALAQNADRQTRATSALVGAYANLSAKHAMAKKTLQDLIASQTASSSAIRKAQREFEVLDKRVMAADRSVRVFNRNVGNYPQLTKLTSGLTSLMAAFGLVGGVYLFASAVKDAFKVTKEFDKATADLAATMGKNRKEITALTNSAKQFGATTIFTAKQVTELQKELAKLGFSEREILASTEGILSLASAVDTDLANAAEVGGSTLRAFNLDASEMGRVVDVMAKGFTSSALDISNFRESIKYVAPIAAASNITIEQTTALLGALADNGIKGSQAGTSLRRIMTDIVRTGKPFNEGLREIVKNGISVKDAFDEVGRTAQTSLVVLGNNIEKIDALTVSLDNAGGAAKRMADEQLDSLNGKILLLTSAWDGFILSLNDGDGKLGKFFVNALESLTDFVTGLQAATESVDSKIQRTAQTFYDETTKAIKGVEAERQTQIMQEVRRIDKIMEKQREALAVLKQKEEEEKASFGYRVLYNKKDGDMLEKQRKEAEAQLEISRKSKELLLKDMGDQIKTRKQLNEEFTNTFLLVNKTASREETMQYARAKTTENLKKELAALNNILAENTKTTDGNTDAKKKNIKAVKEQRELVVGSVEWLEKEISMLKEKQSQMSTTTEEYQQHQKEIQTLIGSLEILTGKYKGLGNALKDVGVSISDFDLSDEGVSKWYDEMAEGFQNPLGDGTDWKDDFQQWSQVALDAIQVVRDAQEQAFQAELFRLEQSRDNAIRFAGESETARAKIDRQYDEKRRALLNRQAKQEKAFAITQSIINTAQGVISALAMTPPNVPLSIAIGVIGAAQTALIASQQIPQFYKGTDNAPEGMAWTQERGAEIITDKSGKVKSLGSNKGAQLTHLNKGDKVFTAQESKSIMFNKELNAILSNNGIANASTIVNNSLDLSPLNARIDNLTNVIKNKSELQMISDRQGERVYKKEQGKRALIVSNRLRIKS